MIILLTIAILIDLSEEASRSFALKIRETVASLAKKYKITDLRGLSENSNNYDKQDVVEYLLNPFFRRIDSLLQKNEHELKLKQMEVEELMHTKHNLSTTAVATPSVSRTTPDSDRRFNGSRTTPASSSRYSDAKMKLNSMSPTAKELARLNSEIVKEV